VKEGGKFIFQSHEKDEGLAKHRGAADQASNLPVLWTKSKITERKEKNAGPRGKRKD